MPLIYFTVVVTTRLHAAIIAGPSLVFEKPPVHHAGPCMALSLTGKVLYLRLS